MKRDILKKTFRYVVLTLFVTFMALYISQSTGYVEYENRKQVALTESQIKKFEADVAAGKKVDVERYLKTNEKNYQNGISRLGLKISKATESGVKTVVETSFKFLAKLAE
ncbi:MAG: hypothetical protein HFH47_01940 [Bacilli bacterium]|nr:hypothetical protein [Bacilli bacterium]